MKKRQQTFTSSTLIPPRAIIMWYQRQLQGFVAEMIKAYKPLLAIYKDKQDQMAFDAKPTAWPDKYDRLFNNLKNVLESDSGIYKVAHRRKELFSGVGGLSGYIDIEVLDGKGKKHTFTVRLSEHSRSNPNKIDYHLGFDFNKGTVAEWVAKIDGLIDLIRESKNGYAVLKKLKADIKNDLSTVSPNTWLTTDLEKELATLGAHWEIQANQVGEKWAVEMAQKTLKNGDMQVKESLKGLIPEKKWELLGDAIPVNIQQSVKIAIKNNVSLIKSIARQYHERVENAIYSTVNGGGSYKDLAPLIKKAGNMSMGRAKFIANNEVHKTFSAITTRRMANAGITKVEWIHDHPTTPRPYHKAIWDGQSGKNNGRPNGLNHFIFDLSNPPIIDPRTGQRGFPGDLIGCRCRLAPVLNLED